MFEALIVTLREGVEAALVVGIILAYLKRTGREPLGRAVYWGLGAGIAASLIAAGVFVRLGIAEEAYEGWLMVLGSFFVISMVIWMWRTGKGMRGEIEGRLEAMAHKDSGTIAAGLFGLTFLLILREGVETILFLGAVKLTSDSLLAYLGGAAGLAIATLFGVAFVRGSIRVDLARFFKVTEIVLLLLGAQLLIGGLHEFGELGSLPVGRREMRLIGPIVKNDVLVIVSLLALPLIVMLVPGREDRRRRSDAQALEGPQRRLALAKLRRDALWRRLLATAGTLIIASLTVSYAYSRLPKGIDPPALLSPGAQEEVRLSTAGLGDGHLHRFGVSIDGVVVRFFVMLSHGKPVPAFDACQVCGASGYVEMKGRLVCLACAADINRETLGTGGGCNPVPLPYREEGGELVLSLAHLRTMVDAFRAAPAAVDAPPVN